jgi:hypothetical protein
MMNVLVPLGSRTVRGLSYNRNSQLTACRLSLDSLVMAAGPRYIASARISQKTPLPIALLLLRAFLLRRSCDDY